MPPPDPHTLAPDPSTTTPPPAAAPAVDLLSEPTSEECIEEWNRYYKDAEAGRFKDVNVPIGHHFAYYGGQIVDHDPDYMTLCARAAAKAGVHWARLVVAYRREPFVLS